MGLHRAGFDVVGIDNRPQPRYPFTFIQGDVLCPPVDLAEFAFIWASPPCQAHTSLKSMWNAKDHQGCIHETRAMLKSSGVHYAIENVPGAPLHATISLCGTMFNLRTDCGAELRRHRWFETSFMMLQPQCQHGGSVIGLYGGHQRNRKRKTIGIHGEGCRDRRRKHDRGQSDFTVKDGRRAMDIDWMTLAELCQAIPPAYSEFIGNAARAVV